jgi:hypothetical protein
VAFVLGADSNSDKRPTARYNKKSLDHSIAATNLWGKFGGDRVNLVAIAVVALEVDIQIMAKNATEGIYCV